jgi:hypothetical protein
MIADVLRRVALMGNLQLISLYDEGEENLDYGGIVKLYEMFGITTLTKNSDNLEIRAQNNSGTTSFLHVGPADPIDVTDVELIVAEFAFDKISGTTARAYLGTNTTLSNGNWKPDVAPGYPAWYTMKINDADALRQYYITEISSLSGMHYIKAGAQAEGVNSGSAVMNLYKLFIVKDLTP